MNDLFLEDFGEARLKFISDRAEVMKDLIDMLNEIEKKGFGHVKTYIHLGKVTKSEAMHHKIYTGKNDGKE